MLSNKFVALSYGSTPNSAPHGSWEYERRSWNPTDGAQTLMAVARASNRELGFDLVEFGIWALPYVFVCQFRRVEGPRLLPIKRYLFQSLERLRM